MALDLKKFLSRFVDEARDNVGKLGEGMNALLKNPDDAETVNSVFRSAHTIKGSSRMMKLTAITEVAHKMEDVMSAVREKKLSFTRDMSEVLFRGLDAIADMIEAVHEEREITADNSRLLEELSETAEGKNIKAASVIPEKAPVIPASKSKPVVSDKKLTVADSIRVKSEKLDELINLMGEIISSHNLSRQRILEMKGIEAKVARAVDNSTATAKTPEALFFGEIRDLIGSAKEDSLVQDLLITELQEKALALRMVPISTVFDPMPRMVRDIARDLGKQVDFEVSGGEIELDRKMAEKLGDPLVHMIRNSIDHGIEPADRRLKAGKQETGLIRLSAFYDAGNVLIEISDDGGGIPIERLKEKAVKKRIIDEASAESMSKAEAIDLIFQPGMSTSAIISDISGRGVGMDVVKRNIIEDMKGTIKVDTSDGIGTSFVIRLPLTLAIMRVMRITASGMTFSIASHYVCEIIRVLESEVITVVNRKAVRLREEFIPVARLDHLLGINGNVSTRPDILIMILQVGSEKLGLIVDELIDEENVVVKSLPEHMKNLSLVSGVMISGRNEVINILHIPALISASRHQAVAERSKPKETAVSDVNILVVDDSVNTREIEKSVLEAYGYKVSIAVDGHDALEKTKKFKYDLIVTDVEMPRLDGFSLTEKLRAEPAYADTPVIIVTSREKEEDKRRGIAVGANAYIVKGSFDQSNLIETVRNLIG